MSRKKKVLPTLMHTWECRCVVEDDGAGELVPRLQAGPYQVVNNRPIGDLNPNWLAEIERFAPSRMSDEHRFQVWMILRRFILMRSGELGAFPWDGPEGVLDYVSEIEKAGLALMAVCDKKINAIGYVWSRLEQVQFDGISPFTRDDFYPWLSQLVARANRLREELGAEKKRGDDLKIGRAWMQFVAGMMDFYSAMGGEITVSKRDDPDPTKHSKFAQFSYAAMLQVPKQLREHVSGGPATFSDALSKAKKKLPRF